jgi:hypothetical protein
MIALGMWGMFMMRRGAAIAALLCSIVAGSDANARGPYGSISVGNWKGGAYTNDQTGAFSQCAAGAQYASGVYFVVMIDGGGGWSLGFAHEQWRLKTGEAFPLTLTFDGQQPFNVHGIPIADKLVRVPMPSNSSLITHARATGNIPENINFAIKTGALRDFLDNSVVPYQISDAKAELKTADIARNARAFTFLISCKAKVREKETARN